MAPVSLLHDTNLRMAMDYAGVAVFAATGALAAARRGFDLVTFAFFAAITGIGGGTLRDLLIGAPVFWVSNAGYVGVCIAAAGLVWALGERLSRFRALLWLDALGLAAYCVVGASKAADWGAPPLVAVVMGVLTATFGGMVRDVLAGEPSVLLRKEIYVTAAVAGAGAFVVVRLVAAPDLLAVSIGVVTAFVVRAGALAWGWTLPGFGHSERPSVALSASPGPSSDFSLAAEDETKVSAATLADAQPHSTTTPRKPRSPRQTTASGLPKSARAPRKPQTDGV